MSKNPQSNEDNYWKIWYRNSAGAVGEGHTGNKRDAGYVRDQFTSLGWTVKGDYHSDDEYATILTDLRTKDGGWVPIGSKEGTSSGCKYRVQEGCDQ
jgi:hypothetical protein